VNRARWWLMAVAGLLCLASCRKDEPPPEPDLDRTLRKLKEEAERTTARPGKPTPPPTGAPTEDPNAKLAQLAAGEQPGGREQLGIPGENPTVYVGKVAVKMLGLWSSHVVEGGKLSLTTEELFLEVKLAAQNTGEAPARLDFGFAKVVDAEKHEWPLARDVQRLAGTNPVTQTIERGDRREYLLYFEVPRGGPGKGWVLLLPAGVGAGNEDVRIPLG
jgi:hypothetical protein